MIPVKNIVNDKRTIPCEKKSLRDDFKVVSTGTSVFLSTHGVGLISSVGTNPEAVTPVMMAPSMTQDSSMIISWSWNMKKETRLATRLELIFMAQNIPEFLVIVSSSELSARIGP